MDIDKDNSYENENVSNKAIVSSNKIKIPLLDTMDLENEGETDNLIVQVDDTREPNEPIDESGKETKPLLNPQTEIDDNYDLNKDWKFQTILQFINVFHNVMTIDPVSTYELEFSLKHSDIEPLCVNVLSKLLMKKEVHRATAAQNTNTVKNENSNSQPAATVVQSGNNAVTGNNVSNASNPNSGNSNVDVNKVNELLLKKVNYFYKTYIRYLKKAYSLTDMTKIFDIINQDVTQYKNRADPFAFTITNISDKFYDDLDTKTFLIIDFFRDLGGVNPLIKTQTYDMMEQIMSNNHQEEDKGDFNEEYVSFRDLTVRQKIKFLYFFCNYCLTFSGRTPLYKEELTKSKDEGLIANKKIKPFSIDKEGVTYYSFPLNKDCRLYKEKYSLTEPMKSSESFEMCVSNYAELEKMIETEKNAQLVKKIKDKLIQFKSNDEEEKKKEMNLLRKQELYEKAKKLSTMNTNNISEVEKYKNNDFLLMNISNHVITRNQLNQIAKINQQTGHSTNNKVHELTEEERHKMKIERENLERERRMEKRNRIQEKIAMEEKYKLEHGGLPKMNNKKRNRDKKHKSKRKRWSDDDEDEYTSSSNDLSDNEESGMKLESDSDDNYYASSKRKKVSSNVSDGPNDNKPYLRQPNNKVSYNEEGNHNENNNTTTGNNTIYIETQNDEVNDPGQTSDIINEGYLIYRYSSNQIEIEGNWYVANDPLIKERISYLFSGSNQVKDVHLTLNEQPINENNNTINNVNVNNPNTNGTIIQENINDSQTQNTTNNTNTPNTVNQIQPSVDVKLCSANLFECITIDALLKNCLDFLNGDYSGYFMYYGKTIEDRLKLTMEIEDSLVKCIGDGVNNLGTFKLIGYMNFFRTKDVIFEKNKLEEPYIKLAEFKMTKIYNEFKYEENDRVIKSYNHRRKKNTETSDYYEY